MKITCVVQAYNEADRIGQILQAATKWADEVLVINKCSTDATADIARGFPGVRVVEVPFTKPGRDDHKSYFAPASNDWCLLLTCSEIPTRGLITAMRELLESKGDSLDLILIPKKLWSFGVHSANCPWSISYQPFLINRKRAVIGPQVHANFTAPQDRVGFVKYSELCHMIHLTHPTVEKFLQSHIEYMIAESETTDPSTVISRSLKMMANFPIHKASPELFGHACAWSLYHLGCCLAAWEKKLGKDVPKFYEQLKADMLRTNWPDTTG